MAKNKKTIIANWKMNPATLGEAKELFSAIQSGASNYTDIITVICPPFVYIEELAKLRNSESVIMGAQDIFWEESGAFTGEISGKMLNEFGVEYVLVGHSERRSLGETDEMVNKKISAILAAGMRPVLLVGEKERGEYRQDILIDQLSQDLSGVSAEDAKKLLLVYEPVWAISSHSGGISDTLESALEAIKIMREILTKMFPEVGSAIPILYGGSVNPETAIGFLSHPEIAGAVVGSASLKPEAFIKILQTAFQS